MWSNPSQMIVHDHQWKIPRDKLIQEVPGRDGTDTVLERNSSQRRKFSAEALPKHGGEFDPSRISHKTMGREVGEERVYSRLNKLLKPGELRGFVETHSEFACRPRVGSAKGFIVHWGPNAPSGSQRRPLSPGGRPLSPGSPPSPGSPVPPQGP